MIKLVISYLLSLSPLCLCLVSCGSNNTNSEVDFPEDYFFECFPSEIIATPQKCPFTQTLTTDCPAFLSGITYSSNQKTFDCHPGDRLFEHGGLSIRTVSEQIFEITIKTIDNAPEAITLSFVGSDNPNAQSFATIFM